MNPKQKLATVAMFVMDGVNRVAAGDWEGTYPPEDEPAINLYSNQGEVEAYNLDGHGFDLMFGGQLFRVKVSKVSKP